MSKPREYNIAAIFGHFPPGLASSQKMRQNISHYQAPKPSTPLISPTDILVSMPVSPHTLW